MADKSTWADVPLPRAHVLARLLGRSGVLMDPGSRIVLEVLFRELGLVHKTNLRSIDQSALEALLAGLLELAVHVSDELDRRTLPG